MRRESGASISSASPSADSVCELAGAAGAIARLAQSFDPSTLSVFEAEVALSYATEALNRWSYLQGALASRLASFSTHEGEGERSAAHQIARRTGNSVGQAFRLLDTASKVAASPELAEAASSGKLSARQAELIADATSANSEALPSLLDTARSSTLADLRRSCTAAKAAVADREARRRQIHARRYLRTFTDSDGGWNLHVRNNPEVGAQIEAAICDIADVKFTQARQAGVREAPEAYRADALEDLARGHWVRRGAVEGGGGGQARRAGDDQDKAITAPRRTPRTSANAKVIVRIDLDTLLRGYPIDGETCEIAGLGPIARSAVVDMIDSGDPFLTAVATKAETVVGVAHLGRHPTARQMTALQWLYPTCAVEGCTASTHLEADHRVDWADSHVTLVDLMDRLCTHHHDVKSQSGWALVEGTGKRAFVSPGDPRHPRYSVKRAPPKAA